MPTGTKIMTMTELGELWAKYNKRTVTIDGDTWIVYVRQYLAKYPYERVVMDVSLTPTEETKATAGYRATKRKLGDNWFRVIRSENHVDWDLAEEVLEQL